MTINVPPHYDDFHATVILNGDKNALWERRENRHVAQSEESRVIGQNVLMVNSKNKQEMNRIYEVHATQ